MSRSVARVKAALEAAGVAADVVTLEAETRTADQAAAAVGVEVDRIAKSILFEGRQSGELILFLTAGGNRVDAAKAAICAGEPLGRAEAARVRAVTGFAIGGVAPIGHLRRPRAVMDPRLMAFPTVWAAGGTPRTVFEIAPDTLCSIACAALADFTP